MTLRIGITARLLHEPPAGLGLPLKPLQFLESSMAHWIMAHRALALMVPFIDEHAPYAMDRAPIEDIVQLLDGLVLQGGVDIAPETYGEAPLPGPWPHDPVRDRYELALLRAFLAAGKPVLGICRGAQLLNVAMGGTLVQDIPTQRPGAAVHQDLTRYDRLSHPVRFLDGSLLQHLYGRAPHRVTSIHHQCVDRLGAGLVVEAISPEDGIIEAIRVEGDAFALGVQWHPEFHLTPRDAAECLLDSAPMMQRFLAAARARADRHRRVSAAGSSTSATALPPAP
jgi:putative glutamine amidotransferase